MEKKNKTTLVFIAFLIITSFLIKFSPLANPLKKITLGLFKIPLEIVDLSFVPAESIIACYRSLKENKLLKKENQQLKVKLMQLQEAEAENKRLQKLLNFKSQSDFSLVTSEIISFDASNLRKSLVIDRGSKHGINQGNPVIASEGVVGMVVETNQSTSRIILINDLDFSMAAKVKRSNAIGIISGSLEGLCRLKYLELDEDIKIGDEIVSTKKNSRYPDGIPIGVVTQISKDQSGLSLFAVVKPSVSLSSLEEVLVIINY
ncbi:MAG: rod shape-determining protein MreC [Candidatus Omnitrophota bacterium]